MISIFVAIIFFIAGTIIADWWEEKESLSLSEQLDLARQKGENKKNADINFFTKMVIRELKKDLSAGYTTSYYSGTLWWKIKNDYVAKEVSKNVSELTGLDFTSAPRPNNTYYVGCPNTTAKKES